MTSVTFQDFEASMSTVYFDMLLWISDTKLCFMHLHPNCCSSYLYNIWGLRGWDQEYLPSSQKHQNCFISNPHSEMWVTEMLFSFTFLRKMLIENFYWIKLIWKCRQLSQWHVWQSAVKIPSNVYMAFSSLTVHKQHEKNPGKVLASIH